MIQNDQETQKFTKKEKVSILKEATKKGVKKTLNKFNVSPATYYYRKKKYANIGANAITDKDSHDVCSLRQLEKENERLKQLLSDKELESKQKDEMLKEMYPHLKKLL